MKKINEELEEEKVIETLNDISNINTLISD